MHSVIYSIIVILSVLFTSCNFSKQRDFTEVGDTLQLKYAHGVDVIRYQDYTIVNIKNYCNDTFFTLEIMLKSYLLHSKEQRFLFL